MKGAIFHMTGNMQQCYISTIVTYVLYNAHSILHSSSHKAQKIQKLNVKIICREKINHSTFSITFFRVDVYLKKISRGRSEKTSLRL